MNTSRKLLAMLLLCAVPSLAFADSKGLYGGIAAGGNFLTDSDLSGSGVNSSVDFDTGWVGSISLGYGFENGVRVETEIGHRDNDADNVGSAKAWNFMGNVLYDVSTGTSGLIPTFGTLGFVLR